MSNYRKKLRGALGHGLFGLCINPSLRTPLLVFDEALAQPDFAVVIALT